MRQIVLDTETTGLDWRNGHRVIEIGCVELVNRSLTGRHFHVYLNPERAIDAEAEAVHGISLDFLADKPKFESIAADFEAFVAGAELLIHNASFDVGFLNAELSRCGRDNIDSFCPGVIDTLRLAKEQNPGKKASLDALCERYAIDNGHRTLHGALLDAEILAEVYLAMTRGQETLAITLEEPSNGADMPARSVAPDRPRLKVVRANEAERAAHAAVLADIEKAAGHCLWRAKAETSPEAGLS